MDHVSGVLSAFQKQTLLDDATLVAHHGRALDLWPEDTLRAELSLKLGLPWMDASPSLVDHALFAQIGPTCRTLGFLPTYRGTISMHVFMTEPFHGPAIRALRNLFHCEIHPIGVSRRSLERTLSWLENRVPFAKPVDPAGYKVESELLSWNYSPQEGIKFIERVLFEAYQRGASDVFLENFPDRLDIRFKTGAGCVVMPPIEQRHASSVMADAKAFAAMSPRETRGYRDGSAELKMPDGNVLNFRAVAQKALSGETFTFRLLDKRVVTSLSKTLPVPPEFEAPMRALLAKGQGMIIVCGPTGSGKSTTLWRFLLSMDSSGKRIMTIEDPVEYRFDRFIQLPVKGQMEGGQNEDLPETFEAAIRSCLRAAPDVILVGEMRDSETGQAAVTAALTGHLLLTTVHSPDAIGAIPRLLDLKVSALNIRQTVLAIIAQRLGPKLCPHCKIAEPVTQAQKDHFAFYGMAAPEKLYRAGSCPVCHSTGFIGRVPVLEFLVITPELRALIKEDVDELRFRKLWIENGGRSLGMHALQLAAEGTISYTFASQVDSGYVPEK